MPWAQFDDHFPESEPALTVGVEACGLHLLATCWCAAHLSDGLLPAVVLRRLLSGCVDGDGGGLVDRLVEAGLWVRQGDGGFLLTDFLLANRSRRQVEGDRERKAQAGRRGGRATADRNREARESFG